MTPSQPEPGSSPLLARLHARIAAGGPISFRDFMAAALYDPADGYYASGRARIGRKGDFFTNVSVGPLFGRLLARYFLQEWERLGHPSPFTIVEEGAHGGDFAHDAISELLRISPALADGLCYHIIEPAPNLASLQKSRLHGMPVKWFATPEEMPPFIGVHFSNELLDAFPVHRVKWDGTQWLETMVDVVGGQLAFADAPLSSPALRECCERIPQLLPPGYTTEVRPASAAWISGMARKLVRGSVLIVDYGYPREVYYSPERATGTLSGYAGHTREADLLAQPGEVDITAHVEFTSVIEAGVGAGLKLAEFTDQHRFIVPLGMQYLEDGGTAAERRAFMTLMHPEMMGRAFKVLRMEK